MAGSLLSGPAPLTFTLDVEDHRPDDSWPERFPDLTRRILDHVDAAGVRGTVFIVGEEAERHPDLVRDIAARGHELALHAWRHVPLTEVAPTDFRDETARGKAVIEEITGLPVAGFRAPTASLVPASAWAVDVLGELGFRYSSSVISGHNPLFGWPGTPRQPFLWPNGLVELPIPFAGIGNVGLPHLGGTYFRVLPWPVVWLARRTLERTTVPNLYCHPYDFDAEEPRWAVPGVQPWGIRLLWMNRSRMFAKLDRLVRHGRMGPPLVDRIDSVLATAETFHPTGPTGG
jgi:polysaccharide deacetylase family protein (PEP-CTERM system associated)